MRRLSKTITAASLLAGFSASFAAWGAEIPQIRDGRIAYAVADAHWAVYQTADGKKECPQGLNPMGPREIFKDQWPNGGKLEDTILVREGLNAFPADHAPLYPYLETQGNIGLGLNLDGKIGPKDFTSPDGDKGIDNAFYRVTGCATGFRGPDGQVQLFASKFLRGFQYNRMLIEISGADNVVNAPSVDVTIMRGRDPLLLDSTGEAVAPGGSQRIDDKYGKPLVQHLHGKIENGVLTTDPVKDGIWAWQIESNHPRALKVRDMRFSLKLTPTGADGMLGGYFDVATLLDWTMGYATHHLAYDRLDAPEFYWALRKAADAYPDPKTGENTALSSAIHLVMSQVFIQHPDKAVAEDATQPARAKAHDAQR